MAFDKLRKKIIKKSLAKFGADSSDGVLFCEDIVRNLLAKIGIGSGGGVESSGEEGVFRALKTMNAPYCIFDVGANCGKYLDLIVKNIYGGGDARF